MSTSVLPQLLEVDSELSAQVSALEAQLNQLQEKRKGIQTVIAMFESGGTLDLGALGGVTSESPEPVEKAPTTKPSKSSTAKVAKRRGTRASKAETGKAKSTKGRVAKAKTPVTEKAKKTTKAAKRSGRTANWQRYVQEAYRKAPLPDVIVGVLQAQPDNVFKIADVMSAVFREDMPKNHFLKARNRVSNILSAGARDGDWYRGRGGTYSLSEKAIKAAS